MLEIGLRLHDSEELEFGERLMTVKKQGFSCIHMALKKTMGLPFDKDALTAGYAAWIRKQLDEAGLDLAVLGCYLNLANPNRTQLTEIQETYRAHLRFASMIGSGLVGTETGAPNETYTCDESCHTQAALDLFISNLRPVVRDAERLGQILAIEPVAKHIVSTPRKARIVLDSIASPNLQIIFDPVNLLDEKNADHAEEVFEEALDLLGPDIALVHLKDFIRENGQLKAVGCGLGEMNYRGILKYLKEKKPYIQATLENTRPENAVQCRQFIEREYAAADQG
jgi:sugar phosphate isomerase/epimerase